jgi:hypothetical protein
MGFCTCIAGLLLVCPLVVSCIHPTASAVQRTRATGSSLSLSLHCSRLGVASALAQCLPEPDSGIASTVSTQGKTRLITHVLRTPAA